MHRQYRPYPVGPYEQPQIVEAHDPSCFWQNATRPVLPIGLVNQVPPHSHFSAPASDPVMHASLYVLSSKNGFLSLHWHNVPLTRGARNRCPPCTPPTIEIPWSITPSTTCPPVSNINPNFDGSTNEAPGSCDLAALHASSQAAHTGPLDQPASTPSLTVRLVSFVPSLRFVKETVIGDD